MSLINLEQYSDKQNRAITRILDTLDRLEKRTNPHFSDRRKHERKDFRGVVWIRIPQNSRSEEEEVTSEIRVWARSLSQSGLSFIYPFRIYTTEIEVGVPVENHQAIWFRAEIVRQKEIGEESFWEFGVKFLGKVRD